MTISAEPANGNFISNNWVNLFDFRYRAMAAEAKTDRNGFLYTWDWVQVYSIYT